MFFIYIDIVSNMLYVLNREIRVKYWKLLMQHMRSRYIFIPYITLHYIVILCINTDIMYIFMYVCILNSMLLGYACSGGSNRVFCGAGTHHLYV